MTGARPWLLWSLTLAACVMAACRAWPPTTVLNAGDLGRIAIAHMTNCQGDAPPRLDPRRPLAVMVHGQISDDGERGPFEHTVSRTFRGEGQQALCFEYDSRARLDESAAALRRALDTLARHGVPQFTVVAYSLGGLVARRAVTQRHPAAEGLARPTTLVTVASPFGGIARAEVCGKLWAHVISLGTTAAICDHLTGRKWIDIPPNATFIRRPGKLLPTITRFVRIITREPVSDRAFALVEQQSALVDRDGPVTTETVDAGHRAVVPRLPELLRRLGVLR